MSSRVFYRGSAGEGRRVRSCWVSSSKGTRPQNSKSFCIQTGFPVLYYTELTFRRPGIGPLGRFRRGCFPGADLVFFRDGTRFPAGQIIGTCLRNRWTPSGWFFPAIPRWVPNPSGLRWNISWCDGKIPVLPASAGSEYRFQMPVLPPGARASAAFIFRTRAHPTLRRRNGAGRTAGVSSFAMPKRRIQGRRYIFLYW